MPEPTLPLIADYRPDRAFAWRNGEPISCGRALAAIQMLATRLPCDTPCINVCDDRYYFTLTFAAVALAGGVNLLPQSRAEGVLAGVRDTYPDAQLIDDDLIRHWLADTALPDPPTQAPTLAATQKIAVVFTSGSTGQPSSHAKYWRDLHIATTLYGNRFFPGGGTMNTVATVPPQHMYGLETSVLPALHIGFAADTRRPFMPWTVAETLASIPAPRVLITTPVHLRACLEASVTMPQISRIISATAPLTATLARAAETAWHTEVHEIYGSSETGSVASRRTSATDLWTLYDGMALEQRDGFWLTGSQLPAPFPLSDELVLESARQFRLMGRDGDMLKVAGKRLSMNALTQHLLAIEGVADAIAFLPADVADAQRPAALVVAPDTGEREIAAQLARVVDPVFVPRPLLRVASLPRNALGKLPRAELVAALAAARHSARRGPS